MRPPALGLAPLALFLAIPAPALIAKAPPVRPHMSEIRATAISAEVFAASARFRLVRSWVLQSDDRDFGGFSALLKTDEGFLAVTDRGAIVELEAGRGGAPITAAFRPLPKGCGDPLIKSERDAESIARDADSGVFWLGLEWRNAVCRADLALARATALVRPVQMRSWGVRSGLEAMTRLADGRMVVIAERKPPGASDVPMLIYDGDPASPGARARELVYRPPAGYATTGVVQTPGGDLLILHRRFRLPVDFSTIVSIVPLAALSGPGPVKGRPLALLKAPGISDNFEAIAAEEREGRVFVWLMSDDNFVPTQKTYLLEFELRPPPAAPSSRSRASAARRAG